VADDRISAERMAKEILLKIFELANKGINVTFEEDWGGGTITIYCNDRHTHCGFPEATSDELIESIYNTLVVGKGLSFDIPIPTKSQGKEKKLTLQELKELTARGDLPTKPASVKIPESVKKYDRIYQTQERTRKLLEDL